MYAHAGAPEKAVNDDQYFLVMPVEDDRLPDLTPDLNTEDRRFSYRAQPIGSAPLVFYNGGKDYARKLGIPSLTAPPGVLFSGSNPVVKTEIRDALLPLEVPHLHMHPTVYIHDDGTWHEDYWYMTFTKRFDCWDRKRSDYEPDPIEMGGMKLHSIYRFKLDDDLLEQTPLQERLLFQMGGSQDAFVVCHESIAGVFRRAVATGVMLMPIADY